MAKKTGLGKGLGALIPSKNVPTLNNDLPDNTNNDQEHISNPLDILFTPNTSYTNANTTLNTPASDVASNTTQKTSPKSEPNKDAILLDNANVRKEAGFYAEIPISQIVPNEKQPRTVFNQDEVDELSESIKEVGILQPIIVRSIRGGKFELVMGERRLRAAELAGIERVPAIVREVDNNNMLRDALIENIHRVNLNPLEEAAAYAQLMNDFGITQNELSKQIARSRSQIANTLRLLNLPVSTQKKVAAKVISAGHARALLSFEDSNVIDEVAERIIKEALSVRDVEELAVLYKQNANNLPKHEKLPGDTALGAVHDSMDSENRLTQYSDKISDILETEALVTLQKVGGKITIRFSDIADLNRIVEMITRIAEHSDGDEF